MRLREWDDPKLKSFDEVNKDWYKDGSITVLDTASVRCMLWTSDTSRFTFILGRVPRLVDKWNWGGNRG